MSHTCKIGPVEIGRGELVVIAGPCMAESKQLCLDVARHMADVCGSLGLGYVFKASYDKANRTSLHSDRGPGLQRGLEYLAAAGEKAGVPLLCDVHETAQVAAAAEVLDCIQIPAFLCRQTDLIVAAAKTGKAVNLKKGQFLAPWDMGPAVEKVRSAGNAQVLLTERGTSFGYNRLVTDFRGIRQMQAFAPVAFDATHSIQEPAGQGKVSGGQRQFAPLLAQAAVAAGADALFVETHPKPDQAKSDAACQMPLAEMSELLTRCKRIFEAARADA